MTCPFCRCSTRHAGTTTLTLERGESLIVVRDVPAEVCDNCDEPFVSDAIAAIVLVRADEAVLRGAQVEVLRFAA
jgi:YgiT-type zinc finger domain-containing protein